MPGRPARRCDVPGALREIGVVGGAGEVRLTRRFGYPGRIDAFERVWLTFASVRGQADIKLNGQTLGSIENAGGEFEVTSLLRERNVLDVSLRAEADDDGLTGGVALEVRCAAYLADVAVVDSRVEGKILGSWPEPLDMYLLVDGEQVHYEACLAPCTFRRPIPPGKVVRIDLAQGAILWGRVQVTSEAAHCDEGGDVLPSASGKNVHSPRSQR